MHQTFTQLPDYDPETDQYNTANRHYSPSGRWMSPDPGGMKVVRLDDPQTWNMYAYVRNNPTTLEDPSGLEPPPMPGFVAADPAGGDMITSDTVWQSLLDLNTANIASFGPPQSAAQQQNPTAQREQAAEHQAQANMAGYGQNSPQMAPGDKPGNMRLVPSCEPGNHNCTYTLTGRHANTYYVWEHQTQAVLGGQNVGPGDYITPGAGDPPERNEFQDDLGGFHLDSYRFFTVSRNSTFSPGEQVPIIIQSGGRDFAYEHIFSTGGVVYINGSTHLQ